MIMKVVEASEDDLLPNFIAPFRKITKRRQKRTFINLELLYVNVLFLLFVGI